MNIKKITANNTIFKSNSLMSSIFDLSLQEQRIVLLLISLVNPRQDKDFRSYEMPVEMFVKVIGVEGKAYHKELDLITDKLMKRSLRIDDPDGGWLKINWLSACQYKKGEGIVVLEISEHLKPYLIGLKSHYTQYRLANILPLRSGYSIRLYELLKQYETVGERYLGVSEMRQMMEIKETEYKNYNDFKKKVILKAQKELLEKTDIAFDFKEKKRVRTIIGIYFFIYPNAKDNPIEMVEKDGKVIPEKEANASIDVDLYERLIKLRFTKEGAKNLLAKYDKERLAENLDYVEFKMRTGKIENPAAYAQTIIKADIRLQPDLFPSKNEEQPKIELNDGMVIEIKGIRHTLECGVISINKCSLSYNDIKEMIRNGEAKIITGDNAP